MTAPHGANTSYCRGATCGAKIMWIRTANGKNMPVDVEETEDGNVAVYRDGSGQYVGRVLTKDHPEPREFERRFTPHMATCVDLRRKRERKAAAADRSSGSIALSGNREVRTPPRR